MQVNAGQVLFRKGDPSDSIYIVLNGRVRAINESVDGTIDIIAEYGQGQSIGELEVISTYYSVTLNFNFLLYVSKLSFNL